MYPSRASHCPPAAPPPVLSHGSRRPPGSSHCAKSTFPYRCWTTRIQSAGLPGGSTAYTKRKLILIRSTLVPETVAVPAFIVPCTLTLVVTNFVPPGANEVTHVRVFFSSPCLSRAVVCSPPRNCFRCCAESRSAKAVGAPPFSVGQSRFPATSSLRVAW